MLIQNFDTKIFIKLGVVYWLSALAILTFWKTDTIIVAIQNNVKFHVNIENIEGGAFAKYMHLPFPLCPWSQWNTATGLALWWSREDDMKTVEAVGNAKSSNQYKYKQTTSLN